MLARRMYSDIKDLDVSRLNDVFKTKSISQKSFVIAFIDVIKDTKDFEDLFCEKQLPRKFGHNILTTRGRDEDGTSDSTGFACKEDCENLLLDLKDSFAKIKGHKYSIKLMSWIVFYQQCALIEAIIEHLKSSNKSELIFF